MDTPLLNVAYIVFGLIGLYFGGNWLVAGASRLASALGVSPLLIGLTVIAVGTSMPELLVSLSAALQGASDIAVGNVIGSNVANIGIILGVTALIFPIAVGWELLRREIPFVIGFSVLTLIFALDGLIDRWEGAALFVSFIIFTVIVYRAARRSPAGIEPQLTEYEAERELVVPVKTQPLRQLGLLLVGLVVLMVGAQLMVTGSVAIARGLGVSELLIGLSLVAVGTSLPELATGIIAALKKENDIVMGNVIGSNIANLLIILGLTALIRPIPVDPMLMTFEFPAMIGFSLILLPLALRQRIGRRTGILLIILYIGFLLYAYLRTGTVPG